MHYSTVSLALRDHPRISPPVRQKIKEIAASLGYSPDPVLSALNAYRKTKVPVHYQSTLAWIDNWSGPVLLRSQDTFNEYFEGAADRARQLGYELEEFRLREKGMTPDRASKILRSRGIKGLLLAPQMESGTQVPLDYNYFSTVTFGYSLQPRVFHLVTNHQFHSIALALKELTGLGYKRIGLFAHEGIDDKVDNAYLMGYLQFIHKNKDPKVKRVEPYLVKRGEYDADALKAWYKKVKPDAIVSIGYIGIVDWLLDIGVEVPRDVGYVRLSVGRENDAFSGIYENGLVIGRTAVDFLVGMLQRGERGFPETPIRILVEGVWHAGTTVRRQ